MVCERYRCNRLQITRIPNSPTLNNVGNSHNMSIIEMAGSLGVASLGPSEGLVWGLKGTGQESDASKSSGADRLSRC